MSRIWKITWIMCVTWTISMCLQSENKSKCMQNLQGIFVCVPVHVSVCECAYVYDCLATHVHERTCLMTRLRQGMPCSSLFHLMRLSQALIDSIYLALTLICLDAARQAVSEPMETVSQLQNVFHFSPSCNKGVQTCIHSSSTISSIHFRLHVSFRRLSKRSV